MAEYEAVVAIGIALAAIVIVPGPNVIAVTTTALKNRGDGLRTALGVSTGDMIWAVSAMIGLGTLLANLRPLFQALKLAGVVYLFVFALRLLRSTGTETSEQVAGATRRAFARGLLIDLSNPKAAVFFTTLFASLLPETLTLNLALAVLATVAVVVYGWCVLLAMAASRPSFHAQYRRRERTINRVAAAALGILGLRLAMTIPESAEIV